MKKRNLFAALLLTVIAPGLGHVYLGQFRRGLRFVLVAVVFLLIATFTPLLNHYIGAFIYCLFVLAWLVTLFIDVIRLVSRRSQTTLKSYNKWYGYLLSFILFNFLLVLGTGLFHALGYQSFYMASTRLAPMINYGDRLMVKKSFPYEKNIKRNQLIAADVYLNDIQKAKNPSKKLVTIISRVYAVSGDSLTKKGNQMYLNGKLDVPLTKHFAGSFKTTEINIIPGGFTLISVPDKLGTGQQRLIFSPNQNIVGKALYIAWSKDFSRVGNVL